MHLAHLSVCQFVCQFPALSWVLSLWLVGWLVVSRVCLLSRVSVSVRAIKQIGVRFSQRVDSVPS